MKTPLKTLSHEQSKAIFGSYFLKARSKSNLSRYQREKRFEQIKFIIVFAMLMLTIAICYAAHCGMFDNL